MRDVLKGLIKYSEMPHQRVIAIEIERRSHSLSNYFNRNSLTVKLAILIFKKMHPALPLHHVGCRAALNLTWFRAPPISVKVLHPHFFRQRAFVLMR
jgi:hypothetical protein